MNNRVSIRQNDRIFWLERMSIVNVMTDPGHQSNSGKHILCMADGQGEAKEKRAAALKIEYTAVFAY